MGRRSLKTAVRRAAAALAVLPAALLAAVCGGCTLHPPQIQRVSWQQNLIHDPERSLTYPALSLFVQVDDPDGLEDLQELYLISDELELYWSLGPETWTRTQQEGSIWIGTSTLALPDGRPLPDGRYRLLLMDLAGEAVEETVYIHTAAGPPAALQAPRVVRTAEAAGYIRLEDARTGRPAPGAWTVWLYGLDNRYRGALEYRQGGLPVAEVVAAYPDLSAGFLFRLYRAAEASAAGAAGWGLIAGPWRHTP